MPKLIDLTGRTFGRLTVIGRNAVNSKLGQARWNCRCVCGKTVTVWGMSLRSGNTQSCGCWNQEVTKRVKTTHGHTTKGNHSSEYRRWQKMKRRCYCTTCSEFKYYGARGIHVCDQWLNSFETYLAFIRSIGFTGAPGQELDRIDNNGNYEPGNLRVTDHKTNCRNTRTNRPVTAFGETLCLSEWAEKAGLNAATLRNRLFRNHWPAERALMTAVKTTSLYDEKTPKPSPNA